MNKYVGKICPYCKTPFVEEDEVVVCSNCDMPHHKDCWIENQGCTTFGCIGTIKAVEGAESSVTATEINFDETTKIFCTRCGAQNTGAASFCAKCGNPLKTGAVAPSQPVVQQPVQPVYQAPVQPTQPVYQAPVQSTYQQPAQQYQAPVQQNYQQNTYNAHSQQAYATNNQSIDNDVVALVGTKQEYYIPKFQEMKTQNKTTSWNWAAFLFAPYWFMYRKMYSYGIIAMSIAFLLSLINVPAISFLSLGGYVAIGVFGNYMYMNWHEKNAQQAKTMAEPTKSQFVQKQGGVDSTALTIAIVVMVFLSIVVSAVAAA